MNSTVWVDASCRHLLDSLQPHLQGALVRSVDVTRLIQGDLLAVSDSPNVVLVGLRGAAPDLTAQVVRDVRTRFAATAIFVCSGLDARAVNQIALLARAGADDLFTIGNRSDLHVLANQIRLRLRAPAPSMALDLIRERLPRDTIRDVAEHAIRNSYWTWQESRIARLFSVSVQGLNAQFRELSMPTLGLWIRTGRHLHDLELRHGGIRDGIDRAARLGGSSKALAAHRRRLSARIQEHPDRTTILRVLFDIRGDPGSDPFPG